MKKVFLIITAICIFIPAVVYGYTVSDFTVNNQPAYAIPQGTTRVLFLDLALPEAIKSIKITNAGTASQRDITRVAIYEDGISPGWDGDELEIVRKSKYPFWDTAISGNFSTKRIFVTMDIATTTASGKTIQAQAQVQFESDDWQPADEKITGFERTILASASKPAVPIEPMAEKGEALSASTIRWYFRDMSNNEFGFRIRDASLNKVAEKEEADLSYLDETGLTAGTKYSGRRVHAFNDRGESFSSGIFAEVWTLEEAVEEPPAVEITEEEVAEEPEEEVVEGTGGPFTIEELRAKIVELQQQIIKLLNQLIIILQEQLAKAWHFLAGLWITLF